MTPAAVAILIIADIIIAAAVVNEIHQLNKELKDQPDSDQKVQR